MKKFSICLLLMLMCGMAVGCSSTKDNNTTTTPEVTENKTDEIENETKTTENKTDLSEVSKELSNKWTDNQIQLNGKVLTMPINLNDLKELGYEIEYNEEYVLNPGDSVAGTGVSNADGYRLSGTYSNLSDKIIDIKDSSLTSINISSRYNEGMDIIFTGGIKFGDDIETVKQILGEPQDTYEGDNNFSILTYKADITHYLKLTFSEGKLTNYELYI